MNFLLEKKYAAAVDVFRQNIALLERDKDNASEGDVSLIHSTIDNSIAMLHCNIAVAEYGNI